MPQKLTVGIGRKVGRGFYESVGGTRLDGDAGLRALGRFTEVAYGWPDLATLAALAGDPNSRSPPRRLTSVGSGRRSAAACSASATAAQRAA